ncbi:hypothetical protein BKA69DRAFT_1126041 [Paraphysoderma sedebokerense]|nr:hypothetical protein BKA69DRAFT_1126041 [Paraphysoderma sedebokerense]
MENQDRPLVPLGPNDILCFDGCDKFLRYGIGKIKYKTTSTTFKLYFTSSCAIHGGMDLYSKYLHWLNVGVTNDSPDLIATYYLETVIKLKGIPQITMSNCGDQNESAAKWQRKLFDNLTKRRDNNDADDDNDSCGEFESHVYVGSIRNPAVGYNWWRRLENDLNGVYDNIKSHVEVIRDYNPNDDLERQTFLFVFLPYLQSRLDAALEMANNRYLKRQPKSLLPTGCTPFETYHFPERHGGKQMLIPINNDDKKYLSRRLSKLRQQCRGELEPHSNVFVGECNKILVETYGKRVDTGRLNLLEVWKVYHDLLKGLQELDEDDLDTILEKIDCGGCAFSSESSDEESE